MFQFDRRSRQMDDRLAFMFQNDAGRRPPIIFYNNRAFRHHGLPQIVLRHGNLSMFKKAFDVRHAVFMQNHGTPQQFRRHFLRDIAAGRTQPPAGNDNIRPFQRNGKHARHTAPVVPHRGLIHGIIAQFIQFSGQIGCICVYDLTQQQFRAGTDNFNNHPCFLPFVGSAGDFSNPVVTEPLNDSNLYEFANRQIFRIFDVNRPVDLRSFPFRSSIS